MGYSEDFCARSEEHTSELQSHHDLSLFQTLTSIQEQTLTFVPKLLAIMIALMIMGNWLLNEIVSFMQMLWGSFGQYI